jgi:hypothetical protein
MSTAVVEGEKRRLFYPAALVQLDNKESPQRGWWRSPDVNADNV